MTASDGFTVWVSFEIRDMTGFLRASRMIRDSVARNEPGVTGYDWYVDEDGRRCHVHEVYDSSEAFLAHVRGEAAIALLPALNACAELERIEVHGAPTEKVARILRRNGGVVYAPLDGTAFPGRA